MDKWRDDLLTDNNAKFDKHFTIHANDILPQVSWGTNPAMTCNVTDSIPEPEEFSKGNQSQKKSAEKALKYMGQPGTQITE